MCFQPRWQSLLFVSASHLRRLRSSDARTRYVPCGGDVLRIVYAPQGDGPRDPRRSSADARWYARVPSDPVGRRGIDSCRVDREMGLGALRGCVMCHLAPSRSDSRTEENAALPHGTGTDRVLGRSDLILIDTGGVLFGYHSDVTRVRLCWCIVMYN